MIRGILILRTVLERVGCVIVRSVTSDASFCWVRKIMFKPIDERYALVVIGVAASTIFEVTTSSYSCTRRR
jgi:hypothetical protein